MHMCMQTCACSACPQLAFSSLFVCAERFVLFAGRDDMPSENSAFAGTDALLPNGQPNLYSVAGNQIHGERLKKQNLIDSSWWDKYRTVTDLKFQYAVGAVPDVKKVVMPEQPKIKLGKEAADAVSDAQLARMSTMQADFYFGQTSELWDYYNKTGALQKKTHNKKGLPGCAHSSRTTPRRRRSPARPHAPLTPDLVAEPGALQTTARRCTPPARTVPTSPPERTDPAHAEGRRMVAAPRHVGLSSSTCGLCAWMCAVVQGPHLSTVRVCSYF